MTFHNTVTCITTTLRLNSLCFIVGSKTWKSLFADEIKANASTAFEAVFWFVVSWRVGNIDVGCGYNLSRFLVTTICWSISGKISITKVSINHRLTHVFTNIDFFIVIMIALKKVFNFSYVVYSFDSTHIVDFIQRHIFTDFFEF